MRLGVVAIAVIPACWSGGGPAPEPPPIPTPPPIQEVVVRDAPGVHAMGIDDRYLFWIGGEDGEEGIWRAEKRPGARAVRIAATTDARGLTLDRDRVWWGDGDTVHWIGKTGGTETVLLKALPVNVWDITRDRDEVVVASYDPRQQRTRLGWYAITDGQPRRTVEMPGQGPLMLAQSEGVYVGTDLGFVRVKPDGTIEQVSQGDTEVQAIMFDGDTVLFGAAGQVHRAARSGGRSVELAAANGVVSDVAADDRFVYWGSEFQEPPGSAIYRVPKAGGRASVVARVGDPSSVIVDGEHLYWGDSERGVIVRRRRSAE